MNLEKAYVSLVVNTAAYFKQANIKKAVLGLSGGLDSALVAAIAVDSLGKENVTALIMPELGATPEKSTTDAIEAASFLGINFVFSPINLDLLSAEQFPWRQTKLAKANLKARVRAVHLYNYANSNKALVLGTSNRSELLLGYYTKYGDGAADVLPLGAVYKTEAKKLAKFRGLPKKILKKKPSAELWKGQTDQKELGASYGKLDKILKLFVDQGATVKQIVRKGHAKKLVERVVGRVVSSTHKRMSPIIIPL